MKFLFAVLLLAAVVVWATPVFAADVAAGKELYGKKCAGCHGVAGEGKDTIAKTFKVELHHLDRKTFRRKATTI